MVASITPEHRRRILLVAGLVLTLWATWQVSTDSTTAPTGVAENTARVKQRSNKTTAAAEVATLQWPQRNSEETPVKDLFNQAPAAGLAKTSIPVLPVLAPPAPAAQLTVRYIGRITDSDARYVFLADAQNQLVSAAAGQTVIDGWQLTSVTDQQLQFRHLATGQEQTLSIGTL